MRSGVSAEKRPWRVLAPQRGAVVGSPGGFPCFNNPRRETSAFVNTFSRCSWGCVLLAIISTDFDSTRLSRVTTILRSDVSSSTVLRSHGRFCEPSFQRESVGWEAQILRDGDLLVASEAFLMKQDAIWAEDAAG